ncbi:molybdopterin cofactor-binding domain-containing protein, partial [Oleiphilus sp. HI0043]|uniref:molybdopterin cofactor-binding domain-containing protein n=6 Tax=Oleiphilus TaxID=141450 RepID=UPI0012E8F1C6
MDTNRREFLKLTTSAGVGLSLGISLNGCNEWNTESLAFSPKAWLSIHTDNRVVITLPKIEMGQGIINAIPAIIAEELDLEWSTIEIKLADADTKHAQLRTSGSSSIKSLWLPLRTGAAGVRGMLLQAAAQTWEVDQQSLSTKNGQVINQQTGKHISYGDLSKLASTFHPPKNPALKKPSEFNFIGNKNPSLNVHDIVKGQAQYGIDTELENLHYAAITHAPTFKSTLASVSTTRQLSSGVKGIVKLNNAVAVVATSYWLAKNVLSTLNITWHSETDNDLNQAQIERDFIDALSHTGKLVKQFGNAFPSGEGISADYHSAYQAHACMEPINCTAHIHDDGCDVWAPTQHPMMALGAAREAYHTQLGKWSSKVLRKLGIS